MSSGATASSRLLVDQVWTNVDCPGLLVPVGSIEQHGPHLPVETDVVIAQAVASAVAEQLDSADCLVAPALPYGSSGEHAGFAGTVSIGTAVLHQVLVELVRSVADWANWVVFVNGHGGNAIALREAVNQLRYEKHRVGWVPCAVPGADAHAGFTETSLMLHLQPERARLERAVVGDTRPVAQVMTLLRTDGVRAVSASGVLGDPTGANSSDGERMFDFMVRDVASRVQGFAEVDETDEHGMVVRP